jgi:hypothetical protein
MRTALLPDVFQVAGTEGRSSSSAPIPSVTQVTALQAGGPRESLGQS